MSGVVILLSTMVVVALIRWRVQAAGGMAAFWKELFPVRPPPLPLTDAEYRKQLPATIRGMIASCLSYSMAFGVVLLLPGSKPLLPYLMIWALTLAMAIVLPLATFQAQRQNRWRMATLLLVIDLLFPMAWVCFMLLN